MSDKKSKPRQKAEPTVDLLDHKVPTTRRGSRDGPLALNAEHRFDQALVEYFAAKGTETNPHSFDALMNDTLRSEALAQEILSLPAMTASQVLKKLSIIDAELLADLDCEAPVDRRHIVAFAALKVDIVRLLATQSE